MLSVILVLIVMILFIAIYLFKKQYNDICNDFKHIYGKWSNCPNTLLEIKPVNNNIRMTNFRIHTDSHGNFNVGKPILYTTLNNNDGYFSLYCDKCGVCNIVYENTNEIIVNGIKYNRI